VAGSSGSAISCRASWARRSSVVAPRIWEQLLWLWIVFFVVIGIVNLVVAFNVPTDLWVNFKLFGLFGLTLVFTLGIGIWLARHMKEVPDA